MDMVDSVKRFDVFGVNLDPSLGKEIKKYDLLSLFHLMK